MHFQVILFALLAPAIAFSSDCPLISKRSLQTKITQLKYSDGTCSILVSPNVPFKQSYRSFNILDDGMLMVFNSFGDGPNSSHTGSRVYFLFPRGSENLKYFLNEDGSELKIETPSKDTITIDTKTTQITSFSGTEFATDEKINRQNKGGFEIKKYHGILMDMGWRLGGSPTEKLDQKSKFSDSKANSCELSNRELFIKKSNGEFELKLSDSELFNLLKARCPGLIL